MIDRQADKWTDDPITRCPQLTFQAKQGHKNEQSNTFIYLMYLFECTFIIISNTTSSTRYIKYCTSLDIWCHQWLITLLLFCKSVIKYA